MSETDEEQIIDAIVELLQANPLTASLTKNANATTSKVVTTSFYPMLNMGEVYETVMRERKVTTPPLPTPLVAVHFQKTSYVHDEKRPARRSIKDPRWFIDVVMSNLVLEQAKRECLRFAYAIRKTIENKNLKFKSSNCHVEDLEEVGFLKREKLPYEYFYRMHLVAKTQ